MNRTEAKNILLLYRSSADLADPEIAEALELAKTDAELARWFEEHCARQTILREKFRRISPPPALKEQIVSEQIALRRKASRERIVAVAAIAAIAVALAVLATFYLPIHRASRIANTLGAYQNEMVYLATSGYGMNLATNDLNQIQKYLAQNQAPADYQLPQALEKTAATGCAIESWNNAKVSLICFRTGKPLPAGQAGDLWLFVTDHAAVKNAPDSATPQISQINQIAVAAWTQNGKLYLLATAGDAQTIQKYL